MKKIVKLGKSKDIDKDIELCWTTNERISNEATQLLINNSIPFTKNWITIPFFLRERFHGAKQMYVISRRSIDKLDPVYKRKLLLSNY